MKPYTCTALRIPHMEKIEILSIDFSNEVVVSDTIERIPLSELRFIEISNKGRINPDYDPLKT